MSLTFRQNTKPHHILNLSPDLFTAAVFFTSISVTPTNINHLRLQLIMHHPSENLLPSMLSGN